VEGVLDNPRLAPPDEMTKARENEEISQTKAQFRGHGLGTEKPRTLGKAERRRKGE
jgi:hypothetical protein